MSELVMLCDKLRQQYEAGDISQQECKDLAARLATSSCFLQGLPGIVDVLPHQHSERMEKSLAVSDVLAGLLTCYEVCCQKLAKTDIPFYRAIIEEWFSRNRRTISR